MRVRELVVTYRPHRSGAVIDGRGVSHPRTAAAILHQILDPEPTEVFVVLLLDARAKLIGVHEITRGSLDAAHVSPATIYRAALLGNARSIVLGHNHPSGDPTPSQDDIDVTRRIAAAGLLLDVDVNDHIIIGDQAYCSFKETGRL